MSTKKGKDEKPQQEAVASIIDVQNLLFGIYSRSYQINTIKISSSTEDKDVTIET